MLCSRGSRSEGRVDTVRGEAAQALVASRMYSPNASANRVADTQGMFPERFFQPGYIKDRTVGSEERNATCRVVRAGPTRSTVATTPDSKRAIGGPETNRSTDRGFRSGPSLGLSVQIVASDGVTTRWPNYDHRPKAPMPIVEAAAAGTWGLHVSRRIPGRAERIWRLTSNRRSFGTRFWM